MRHQASVLNHDLRKVCVRVTRACNANCHFCLAPPDRLASSAGQIINRVAGLRSIGTSVVNLCGGEPTTHREIDTIIENCKGLGFQVRVTTNGKRVSASTVGAMERHVSEIKISLHGGKKFHEQVVGLGSYSSALGLVRRAVASGVLVNIQCVATRHGVDHVRRAAESAIEAGAQKFTVMPFIPRGRGAATKECQLRKSEMKELGSLVQSHGRLFSEGCRVLDLSRRDTFVLETDGKLWRQRVCEANDEMILDLNGHAEG